MSTRFAVVVPARDEAVSIDACLTAIDLAAGWSDVPVQIVVVADGCLDDTAARARRHPGVTVLETPGSNVGGARAAGARHALRHGATWLASTDADSVVPANWITTHLDLARHGADDDVRASPTSRPRRSPGGTARTTTVRRSATSTAPTSGCRRRPTGGPAGTWRFPNTRTPISCAGCG